MSVELTDCFDHGHDILDRRQSLYIVNGCEHESTALREYFAALKDLFAHLLRCAKWQHPLCVHAPSPKDDPVAVFGF